MTKRCIGYYTGPEEDSYVPCHNEVEEGEDWCKVCGERMDSKFRKAWGDIAQKESGAKRENIDAAIDQIVRKQPITAIVWKDTTKQCTCAYKDGRMIRYDEECPAHTRYTVEEDYSCYDEVKELAHKAVQAKDQRSDEDVDQWASRIANDVSDADD